jgi:hypothetical protein
VNVLTRRLRRFIREALALAMIAAVKAMDLMGSRVADAILKGVTEKGKKEMTGKGKGTQRDS